MMLGRLGLSRDRSPQRVVSVDPLILPAVAGRCAIPFVRYDLAVGWWSDGDTGAVPFTTQATFEWWISVPRL
jgi:hypothetical protein